MHNLLFPCRLGEVCAHVAALLFKVELLVSSGFARSTTSQLCEWNNKFRESVEPTRVRDLNIVKHRHGKVSKGVNRKRSAAQAPKAKFPGILDSLYSVLPNAAVFTAFSKYATLGEETDSADEGEIATELPESLYEMYDKTWETLNQSAREEKIDSLLKMRMSHSDVAQIEEKTRVQRKCLLWFQQRCGRITGSVFSKVVKCKSESSAARLAGNIAQSPLVLYETRHRKTVAMKHGIEHEETARQQYVQYQRQHHMDFKCRDAGLFICEEFQFIAASPDGIVECSCCGRGVLEIKCPYKYRDVPINEISEKGFYLDENRRLKDSHEYMFQVQAEMASANVNYCDFVCWSKKGFIVLRILRDRDFLAKHMSVLKTFLRQAVLPQLLSRKSTQNV
ncbi:uncharacterized protein LOC125941938 [Dermacentor silvarum]|uniref:uncharacterized protein LOC125941938 n=1 Tax=Dermacentor silvarum TaxID=543639 RepID=UPI002101130C|nr:uncharacterized protein LOC125941938 [Dermacentor silvarum]